MPDLDLGGAEPAFFAVQAAAARRFYFDLNPSPATPLAVVFGGRETCGAAYRVSRATFPFTCVEVVTAGRGTLELDGRSHDLRPGTAFTYGPAVPHAIRAAPRQSMVKYFVGFAGRRAAGLLADCGLSPGTVARTSAPDAVRQLADELIATAARHSPRGPAICGVVLEHLLLRLAETSVPTDADQSRSFVTFQRCRRYIAEHHRRVRTLGEVGRACGVDVSYLCRLFQRYDQQGPYQYLARLRLAAAAELLQRPGTLVKEVAAELGYADPFHFSRAFKRVYGVAPKHLPQYHRE